MLALRSPGIESITVVNHSVSQAYGLLERIQAENPERWVSICALHHLDPNGPVYYIEFEMCLRDINITVCVVASTRPLSKRD